MSQKYFHDIVCRDFARLPTCFDSSYPESSGVIHPPASLSLFQSSVMEHTQGMVRCQISLQNSSDHGVVVDDLLLVTSPQQHEIQILKTRVNVFLGIPFPCVEDVSSLNFEIFWIDYRANFLSSTSVCRETPRYEFSRNSLITQFWFSNCADCWRKTIPWIIVSVRDVHGATLKRGRSATLHDGIARKLPFLLSQRGAPCNSLRTNDYWEGTKSRCQNNSSNCSSPVRSSLQLDGERSKSCTQFKSLRLTERMSVSPAADGLWSSQGVGRTQNGPVHVLENRRCCCSRHPHHRQSPSADKFLYPQALDFHMFYSSCACMLHQFHALHWIRTSWRETCFRLLLNRFCTPLPSETPATWAANSASPDESATDFWNRVAM